VTMIPASTNARRWSGAPVSRRRGASTYVYRHTFCSHLAAAGVPARTIQELARHENLTTTMRYMHPSPSAKDERIEMLTKSREAGGKAVTLRRTESG
jgi:integrase